MCTRGAIFVEIVMRCQIEKMMCGVHGELLKRWVQKSSVSKDKQVVRTPDENITYASYYSTNIYYIITLKSSDIA